MISELDQIIQRSQTLLLKHKGSGDINSLTFILLFIGLLFFFGVSAVIIKDGVTSRYIVFLVLLVLLFIRHKFKMTAAYKMNQEAYSYTNIDPGDKVPYAEGLVNYIDSGFDLKLARINSVKQFYTIVFPLFMITMKEFFHGLATAQEIFFYLIILLPLSFFIWHRYFKEEIGQAETIQQEIATIRAQLSSAIAKSQLPE